MSKQHRHILRLHWKLYFPLVGLLWLIIALSITYFAIHERMRQKENLENRLLNVNNTVIDAYERGVNLQETVDFIRLFTDKTTLAPLRITVYDREGKMVADNPEATIHLYDVDGSPEQGLLDLLHGKGGDATIRDMAYEDDITLVSSRMSVDGRICSFAALPYEGEVLDFLSVDPMIWVLVIVLGVITSVLAYFGVRAVCRNVYSLRDFARAIASDELPDDVDSWKFSRDELGDVSRNLLTLYRNKIRAEKEKIHFERQIGMNVSHELKTPVGIVKGYLDTVLADEDMPEETRRRFLQRAQQNTDRLAGIVTDISMVMRLSEDGGKLNTTTIDFHALVARLADDIRQDRMAGDMKFIYHLPDPCLVRGYAPLLTNVVLNLVYNAARHSGGTEIHLDWLGETDGYHRFAFADNGHGVDPEHLGRLFDLFYRVDSGRSRKSGGSGLGLPLVRRIITAMEGEITVDNAPAGGLRFTFTLPVGGER